MQGSNKLEALGKPITSIVSIVGRGPSEPIDIIIFLLIIILSISALIGVSRGNVI